jgi:hypothetical protein
VCIAFAFNDGHDAVPAPQQDVVSTVPGGRSHLGRVSERTEHVRAETLETSRMVGESGDDAIDIRGTPPLSDPET